MNAWLFPPETKEVQFDEKWTHVGKKEANCDPDDPADKERGDRWDHVALDAENALLLAIVPEKRTAESCRQVVEQVHARTGGRTDLLLTSDEHAPYETAIREVYGVETPAPRKPGPGRPPKPIKVVPENLVYATVRKERKGNRVTKVDRTLVFGTVIALAFLLMRSRVSSTINTAFVERNNGTDRHQNARKGRKTYRFSKVPDVHDAVTFFVAYCYNFCWCVRTLPRTESGGPSTPAMAAGLTDHVWSLAEWVTFPARPPDFCPAGAP
jgi:hypothetical protein